VRTRRLIIEDDAGRTVGMFPAKDGRASLVLADSEGVNRIDMSVSKAGTSHISLMDQDGVPHTIFGVSGSGVPVWLLIDVKNRSRFSVSSDIEGEASVTATDKMGRNDYIYPH
jgi:hypothetical protein